MIPIGEAVPPGYCSHCRVECRDCLGSEIWPNRPDLADAVVWCCPSCNARVGSHKATGQPLGTAANPELRNARAEVHKRLDPIWMHAYRHPSYAAPSRNETENERKKRMAMIRNTARKRVYEWLAEQLGITRDECHVAMFDLVRCREAWFALRSAGFNYGPIRDWAHERKKKPAAD